MQDGIVRSASCRRVSSELYCSELIASEVVMQGVIKDVTENNEKYISSTRAAEMLQMTSRRVTGLCHEGRLPGAVQIGRNWKIPETSVLKYIEDTGMGGLYVAESMDAYGERLPCAVGNTSFAEIAGDCYYVDKTLLIRDLIDDHNMVTLFTRPRRFGKTLTINMLKCFFEKTEEDTSVYFRNKKIWRCGKRYTELQGRFPVIMLTFKDVKFDSWADSMEAIKIVLKDEYRRHSELYTGDRLSYDDRDYLSRMEKGTLSDVEYSHALLKLTRMLAACHRSKVVILIDEYDTPIHQGYTRGFYQEVVSFMRNFLSGGLKDDPDLAFGVITGIMRVSKENLFSGLNNLTVNTVLDEKYCEYFGFTEPEVYQMAYYYGFADHMDEIRKWYDGYRFGSMDIYNPWSVTNYVSNNGQAKAFWANTSDNEIIREIMQDLTPEFADELSEVMQGGEVHAMLNMEVVYPRISDGSNAIYSFLLLAGYLTPASAPIETEFGTFVSLRLPNTEIRRVYNTEILGFLRSGRAGSVVAELEKAIFLGNEESLQSALCKYMMSCISYFDSAAEGFYHGMVLGMVASLSGKYYIRSNRESGIGRYDLQFEPKTKQLPGIIMEFKSVPQSDADKLDALAQEALDQIDSKEYVRELKERGVARIIKYGIAFCGKQAAVRMQK